MLAYFLLLFVFAIFSWLAFYFSSLDTSLVYQPLRSFFLPIKLAADSEFYSYPLWFLASNNLRPSSIVRIFHELSMWILIIISSLIFYKILDPQQWFILKKLPSFEVSVSKIAEYFKNLPKFIIKIFYKNSKNKFLAKSIFNMSFDQITFWSLFLSGLSIFMIPQDSSDLFCYIARGALLAEYNMNPFLSTIVQIENWQFNPMLTNCLWENSLPSYGPLFMMISFLIVKLSFSKLWLALFLFKLINWIVFAFLLSLLCKILCDEEITNLFFKNKFDNFNEQLAFKKVVYALVALNPLLIFETTWNGHNDIFIALGLLATIYFSFKKNFNLSFLILFLCLLFKFIYIVVLPLLIIYAYKSKQLPFLGLTSGAFITYLMINFYGLGKRGFDYFIGDISVSHKSFYDVLNSLNKYISNNDLPYNFRYIFLISFIIFSIWIFYKFWKSSDDQGFFYYSFLILFVLIMIASPQFHSWFFVVLVPLGALLHPRLIFILSLTHLLSFTFLDQANLINYILMTAIPVVVYFKYLLRQDT